MDPAIKTVVEAIHSSPTKFVLHLAGGASQALGWILSVPGASQTVLEARVLCQSAMVHLLGKVPGQYPSMQLAEELSTNAYNRALSIALPGNVVAGVGFTGSLTSISVKHAEHRCYMSVRTRATLWKYDISLCKGLRDLFEEDNVSSRILLKALAEVSNVVSDVPLHLEVPEELAMSSYRYSEDEELQQLLNGEVCMLPFAAERDTILMDKRRVILPGSFNPLHEGHIKLLDAACSVVNGGIPCFELSVVNADKPPLPVEKIKERVWQFRKIGKTVLVTNQPLFYKKAELLPQSTFVVGFDTAVRLVDAKYYEGSHKKMVETLTHIKRLGCDFLVTGRLVNGVYKTFFEMEVPSEVRDIFKVLPEEVFRLDISSTELRQKMGSS